MGGLLLLLASALAPVPWGAGADGEGDRYAGAAIRYFDILSLLFFRPGITECQSKETFLLGKILILKRDVTQK